MEMETALSHHTQPARHGCETPPPAMLLLLGEGDTIAGIVASGTLAGALASRLFHGDRLRATRRALGLSQSRLAGMLGIYQPNISAAENGACLLSAAAALKLAHLDRLLNGRNALESISGEAIARAIAATTTTATTTPAPTPIHSTGGNLHASASAAASTATT